MDLSIAQSMWVLGILDAEQLPEVALEALGQGVESKELAALAGLTAAERDEAAELFVAGLRSIGAPELTKREALQIFCLETARKIVSGESDAYGGAKAIWHAVIASGVGTHDFDPFIYAASEYEERPNDRALFGFEILKESERVLDLFNNRVDSAGEIKR